MGFKCPVCRMDFERNKEAWKKHVDGEHDGISKIFVDFVESKANEKCDANDENED